MINQLRKKLGNRKPVKRKRQQRMRDGKERQPSVRMHLGADYNDGNQSAAILAALRIRSQTQARLKDGFEDDEYNGYGGP